MISKKRAALICIICSVVCLLSGMLVTISWVFKGSVTASNQSDFDSIKRVRLLNEITGVIENYFYENVNTQELIHNAAKSLMYSTGDKYAAYFTKEEYEQFANNSAGEYYGLGITIYQDEENIVVSDVYENSPAELAGVRLGDIILSVNGAPLTGMDVASAQSEILKKKNETVALLVVRDGAQIKIDVQWGVIHAPKAKHEMMGEVMYIRIVDFNGDCVERTANALEDARAQNAKGIVIDLRNNPGGDLDKVVEIAKMVIGKGVILTVRTRDEHVETYESDSAGPGVPIAVLVNGSSASASEVLAGALKDHGTGILVGEKTFGKGIVQTIFPLKSDGGRVRLTTSRYYTPSGQCIHEIGIEPNIPVALGEGKVFGIVKPQDDEQLQAALEYINEQIK